jgi:hypothetical protein
MSLIPTEDLNFARDPGSNAVINTNVNAYKMYKQQREVARNTDHLAQDVESLKSELGEIKTLLTQLLQNVNSNR